MQAIAGAAFWVFAAHSLTSRAPFLDPRLLLNRNFAIGLLIPFFMGMGDFYRDAPVFPEYPKQCDRLAEGLAFESRLARSPQRSRKIPAFCVARMKFRAGSAPT